VNDTLTHAAECSRPRPTSKPVSPGWFRLTCPECGHVGSAVRAESWATAPTLRPVTTTGYVCRDHHDQPVNFRGKGCTRCPTRTRKSRKASEPSDYEMETYR
jgi:hypothetical protein